MPGIDIITKNDAKPEITLPVNLNLIFLTFLIQHEIIQKKLVIIFSIKKRKLKSAKKETVAKKKLCSPESATDPLN